MTIRPLTASDRGLLADFTCARIGEPWAQAIQETVRGDLTAQLDSGRESAVGLFDENGALCGVASWRIYDVIPPILCRSDIVAVAIRHQRKGYGRRLKEAVIAEARTAGAVAVSSVVHRENSAMIQLNRKLGAVVEDIDDDAEHCLCVIEPLDEL